MTQTMHCERCDFLLYFGENINYRLHHRLSEEKIMAEYHNACPRCKAPLTLSSVRISVESGAPK